MTEQDELVMMLQDSALRFLQDQSERPTDEAAVWKTMSELGWLGLCLPESHGGAGLGADAICTLTRAFGRYAFNTRYVGQCVMSSLILGAVDCDRTDIATLCESLIAGSATVSVAWQERLAQLDATDPATTLAGRSLSGTKRFVAGADQSEAFLVSAVQADEPIVLLVSGESPGLSITIQYDSFGGFGELAFENVSIDNAAVLLRGASALAVLERCLQISRLALAAELEGLASGCLEKTVEHLKTRKQFGHALGAFQALRHRCADLLIETRLAESSWRRAAAMCCAENPASRYEINSAKARCADAAFAVAKEAVQMHGAMGFVEETGIGSYLRNAVTRGAWLGSSKQHRSQLVNAVMNGAIDV